jgi:hypothetical protein
VAVRGIVVPQLNPGLINRVFVLVASLFAFAASIYQINSLDSIVLSSWFIVY